MDTLQSNDGKEVFSGTNGGDQQDLAIGAINMINMPAPIMSSISGRLSCPLPVITLPSIIIRGLYL